MIWQNGWSWKIIVLLFRKLDVIWKSYRKFDLFFNFEYNSYRDYFIPYFEIMLNLKKEKDAFKNLSLEEKQNKIESRVSELSEHYDYFKDLKAYIRDHHNELDEEFLDAVFEVIINLAKEIEKL